MLLHKITQFCKKYGMSESRFGRLAAGDPALVRTLRAGRELREATRQRVESFMEEYL